MNGDDSARVRIDDLTHAAFSGVLRALEERKIGPREWPGPILVGIIAWPDLGEKGFPQPPQQQVERPG